MIIDKIKYKDKETGEMIEIQISTTTDAVICEDGSTAKEKINLIEENIDSLNPNEMLADFNEIDDKFYISTRSHFTRMKNVVYDKIYSSSDVIVL